MMSDNIFSNSEPMDDDNNLQDKEIQSEKVATETSGKKAGKAISSKDYSNIKSLFASTHGCSRIFTATNNGKKVIIKTLKEEYVGDKKYRDILKQEYDLTSQLSHKYIRNALDFTQIDGLGDCLILEYVDGKTLAEHVRVGTLTERQVKAVMIQICDALSYLHEHQIVHCNLTPENILITNEDFRVRIIDIGMVEMDNKTNRELLIKEMEFIAPELIKGEEGDNRSDIYSLGKIIEFISERNISQQFGSVATHCTQFSREQRYDDVSEIKAALTKSHSAAKFIIIGIALCIVAALVFIYVPKIKEKAQQEKKERLAVEFRHAVDKINSENASLCDKYKIISANDPIAVDWTEDSLRLCQQLSNYFADADLKDEACDVLNSQRESIISKRMSDHNAVLLNAFRQAQDTTAMRLKVGMEQSSDSALLVVAEKWLKITK